MSKITVVVALYNKGPYIKRALDSIFSQKFEDVSVIVVDDGSQDDGASIVESYGDKRITLIRQANAGPGAARNKGLKSVESEYVCFLDADDEYIDGFFRETYNFMIEHQDCNGVSVDWISEDKKLSSSKQMDVANLYNGVYEINRSFSANSLSHLINERVHCTWLFKTTSVRELDGFYENRCTWGEDQIFLLKFVLKNKFGIIRKPLYVYHTETSSLNYNRRACPPPMPFLINSEPIYESCSKELYDLLDKFFEIRASNYVKGAMKWRNPDKKLALELLKKFPYKGGNLIERLKAWSWYYGATFIKIIKYRTREMC